MRYQKPKRPTRPVVESFSDGEILDSIALYRGGAFVRPCEYALRGLRVYRDHIEQRFIGHAKPPATIAVTWGKRLYFGGHGLPYFICQHCLRRCAKLYLSSIDVACRRCAGLSFWSQGQRRKARLIAKAKRIRAQLWADQTGRPIRPRMMLQTTFRKHMHALTMIEHAINDASRVISPARQRYRERDSQGRYCSAVSELGRNDV
jgi:hypothetical protein